MQQCPDAAGQRWYSRVLTGSPNQDAPWGNDFHGDRNLRAAIWKPSPAGLCTRVYRGFSHLQTDLPVPMWEGGIDKVCSRSSPSRAARAGFCRAAARRNTRRGSVPSSLCARLVAVAGSTPAPPPHAVGARGFCGSLPRLLLAVHGLSRKGRTPGLADDEAAPHLVRALRRPDTGPARGYLPAVPSGAR